MKVNYEMKSRYSVLQIGIIISVILFVIAIAVRFHKITIPGTIVQKALTESMGGLLFIKPDNDEYNVFTIRVNYNDYITSDVNSHGKYTVIKSLVDSKPNISIVIISCIELFWLYITVYMLSCRLMKIK